MLKKINKKKLKETNVKDYYMKYRAKILIDKDIHNKLKKYADKNNTTMYESADLLINKFLESIPTNFELEEVDINKIKEGKSLPCITNTYNKVRLLGEQHGYSANVMLNMILLECL